MSDARPVGAPSASVRLVALIRSLVDSRVRRFIGRRTDRQTVRELRRQHDTVWPAVSPVPAATLRRVYDERPISRSADTFVLYRIIGNDLRPRHAAGQSRANVAFILAQEPTFADCEKRWILNRIHDSDEESAIIELLELHDQPYLRLPFEEQAYQRTGWDPAGLPMADMVLHKRFERLTSPVEWRRMAAHVRRHKNLYAMNSNGARNAALADGRGRAKWVMPFDGNCFFTRAAFESLRSAVTDAPWHPYFVVPMARMTSNEDVFVSGFHPDPTEEPQLMFRTDATEIFDECFPYGSRPKVELLWRLGVPGVWDGYKSFAYDLPRPARSPEAGTAGRAGWVVRLFSGRGDLEVGDGSAKRRWSERNQSIVDTLDHIDAVVLEGTLSDEPVFYDPARIRALQGNTNGPLRRELHVAAEAALLRGPYSVVFKPGLPPSGNPHDYFSVAPYFWPNPVTRSGRPFVRVDGCRNPLADDYGPDVPFDRGRVDGCFRDVTVLCLASTAIGDRRYALRARQLLRTWFTEPTTRMTPHLRFAQVRFDRRGDEGQGFGLIEFRDVAYLLDGIRLLEADGLLPDEEREGLRAWFGEYLQWLEQSPQGQAECRKRNNHGVYYDMQLGAIALFLGDLRLAALVRNRNRLRLLAQVRPDGALPEELDRATPRHYVAFSLAGWSALARVCSHMGDDLWGVSGGARQNLPGAFTWLAEAEKTPDWRAQGDGGFPVERLVPLWADLRAHNPSVVHGAHVSQEDAPAILSSAFGIPPFWKLLRSTTCTP
jgi:hypothetical protein